MTRIALTISVSAIVIAIGWGVIAKWREDESVTESPAKGQPHQPMNEIASIQQVEVEPRPNTVLVTNNKGVMSNNDTATIISSDSSHNSTDYKNGKRLQEPVDVLIERAKKNADNTDHADHLDAEDPEQELLPMVERELSLEELAQKKYHYRLRMQMTPEFNVDSLSAMKYEGELPKQHIIVGDILYVVYKNNQPSHSGTFRNPTRAVALQVPPGEDPHVVSDTGSIVISIPADSIDSSSFIALYELNPSIPHDQKIDLKSIDSVMEKSTFKNDFFLGEIHQS